MAPKAKKQPEQGLTFVITTNPNDTNTAANKKRVRSIAALKSWPERRKRTFEQFAETNPTAGPSDEKAKPRSRHQQQTKLADNEPALIQYIQPAPTKPIAQEHLPADTLVKRQHVSAASDMLKRTEDDYRQASELLTPPPTPNVISAASDRSDPFDCYPVPRRPWFDRVLHHMLTIFAPRGWPALKITTKEGLHWEWFMTQHALSEPALFYVRLLFASGDMIRLGVLREEASYWLCDHAIKAINEALSDPKRATSDPLILAVGRIALHESMYGDRQAANTIHRPAQRRMIAMRGGMGALEFPELVKRLMRWSDRVMAMQGGTERYLEDDVANKNYTMHESVDVSENWFGKDGQALRRKIKIFDLVNEGEG